jgi:hypothetical protein
MQAVAERLRAGREAEAARCLVDGITHEAVADGPPFDSNRNYEVLWGAVSEPRAQASGFVAHFQDRRPEDGRA